MKIAISGTYSSGKTTTTIALEKLTGIPRTHAKTMREILPKTLPGKKLEDVTGPELVQLGIRRLTERAVYESKLDDFFSDGSSLHEWVYGTIRMEIGIHPNKDTDKGFIELPEGIKTLKEVMSNFGDVAKDHALETYDEFIHLPVEFPIVEDGHRPVSEVFRNKSDELLLNTVKELQIPYHVVGGSIHERLHKIIEIYGFEPKMSIEQAIKEAQMEVNNSKIEIEKTFYNEK